MKRLAGIYLITCTVGDGLPYYYVGQSVNLSARRSEHFSDLKQGCHSNPRLQRCWEKYGKSAFKFDILLTCSVGELDDVEQWFLDEMHGHRRVLNIAGEVLAPNRGKETPQHVREKISKKLKGRIISQEARAAISKKLTGTKLSPEACKKLSDHFKGRTFSEAHKEKLAAPKRTAVVAVSISTGEVMLTFASMRHARDAGFSAAGVCRCCNGKQGTHRGYAWRFA